MRLAKSFARLGSETAFEVLARAKQLEAEGREIVHLEIGEPDFDTPQHVIDAACEALNSGWTHYGPSAGDPELRAVVAEHINKSRGTNYSAENVVIVPGAKPIIYWGITALVDPGDEVIYPNPGFPIYESMINFVGGKPVPIPLLEKLDFRLDVEQLIDLVNDKTRMIILNSPQNPTGGVLTRDDLEAIAKVAIENDIMVMSDEPYEQILYEGEHHSIAAVDGMADRTIILDCFSKSFAMTGWRLGYGVCHPELAAAIAKFETNCNSCTTSFVQRAGITALQGPMDETRKMVETFRERRDVIVDGLNAIPGITCLRPKGAFYAFPNITGTGYDCRELAKKCLEEAGVACLAGTAFGQYGEGYLRFSYANSVENIQKALERISDMLS
ncbi:MAG: pyridoxal phosphate-dependent aminotransferase [candidate division WS1 bacterium]|jgi:aspartate/methionine/tyrosine aminotransferase|nr:pyridoxal phosphate-dependent aminotransferase [candidate division WS1 bacterium]